MDFELIEKLSDEDIQTLYNNLNEQDNYMSHVSYIEIMCGTPQYRESQLYYNVRCGQTNFSTVGFSEFTCSFFIPEKHSVCGYQCAFGKVISCRNTPDGIKTNIEIVCGTPRYIEGDAIYNVRCGQTNFSTVGFSEFTCAFFIYEKRSVCGYQCAFGRVISCKDTN